MLNTAILSNIDRLGRRVIDSVLYVEQLMALIYLTLKQFTITLYDQISQKHKGIRAVTKVVVMQIYFTGVQSLPLITLLGSIIGAVVVLQSFTQLSKLGGLNQMGELIVFTIIRDVGPLLTILIVIARSGTAIASEIATMKVNHEIDALESLGIPILEYIVVPRVIGGLISVFCINIWFSAVGVVGGYLLATFIMHLNWDFYINSILLAISKADLILFVLKNFIGGAAVFVIACLQGLSANVASYEVPIVTIGCVVKSLFFVLIFHGLSTLGFYFFSHNNFISTILGVM